MMWVKREQSGSKIMEVQHTTGIRKVTWLKRRAKVRASSTEHLESTE